MRGGPLGCPGDTPFESRQKLALEFGATDIVTERGDEGIARIKEMTGGHVGYVGVSHDVSLPGMAMFFSLVRLHGGPAPVRRFLPGLVELIGDRTIDPGKVFDLELPLEQAAEGYRAMDERRAIKALLRP